jgi:hypothetical protein
MELIEILLTRYFPISEASDWVSDDGFRVVPPLRIESFAADPFSYFYAP